MQSFAFIWPPVISEYLPLCLNRIFVRCCLYDGAITPLKKKKVDFKKFCPIVLLVTSISIDSISAKVRLPHELEKVVGSTPYPQEVYARNAKAAYLEFLHPKTATLAPSRHKRQHCQRHRALGIWLTDVFPIRGLPSEGFRSQTKQQVNNSSEKAARYSQNLWHLSSPNDK